jgi:hypothetical protein
MEPIGIGTDAYLVNGAQVIARGDNDRSISVGLIAHDHGYGNSRLPGGRGGRRGEYREKGVRPLVTRPCHVKAKEDNLLLMPALPFLLFRRAGSGRAISHKE